MKQLYWWTVPKSKQKGQDTTKDLILLTSFHQSGPHYGILDRPDVSFLSGDIK